MPSTGSGIARWKMPYQYLEEIAKADVAFEAWGETREEMFIAAADAMMNVMVADLATIRVKERRTLRVEADALDMLLFELLQELIFQKDAARLLLRVKEVEIMRQIENYRLTGVAEGEELDPQRHDLVVDVKAVTLHRFGVERTDGGWKAMVILDI